MQNLLLRSAQTSVSMVVRIINNTTGLPETGIVYNTAGFSMAYRRELATDTAITLVTLAALNTAWASGGFKEIGHGYYRIDVPDAAFAAGSSGVLIHGTGTGITVIGAYAATTGENAADVWANATRTLTASTNLTSDGTNVAKASDLATVAGYVDTEIASIISTLATMTSSIATLAGYVDTEVAAIKAKTDQMVFTTAGNLDVRVNYVIGQPLQLNGSATQQIGGP